MGSAWWIDALGATQIGERSGTAIAVDFDPVAPIRPERGLYTIATEDLATWLPGATFQKSGIVDEPQTISSVSIALDGGKLRLEVLVNV